MAQGRLEGKVAFITGAARGQGRSHAVRLAQEGADIIAIDLCDEIPAIGYKLSGPEDLKETIRQVEQLDRRIIATVADVRNYDAVAKAVADGVAQLGRLDIVAANAGICGPYAKIEDMTIGDWQTTIDIDLTGVFHTAKACIPHIRAGGRGGSMALTSSLAGFKAFQNNGHYVAAKHGVVGLMRTLALELAPDMIRVNSIHPTQVDTPMIMNQGVYDLFNPQKGVATQDDFAPISQAMNSLPIPWVQPVDISNMIVFLASDEARYITGVAMPVDAGAKIV